MKYPDTLGKPLISVIIVNYNNYRDTVRFIREDLLKQEDVIVSVVIVENNSPNESWEMLNNEFSGNDRIHLIQNEINSGYSVGNNLGISFLENINCDYVLVSNSDIKITNLSLLQNLVKEYEKLQNVALISPVMKVNGRPVTKLSAWKLPTKLKEILDSTFFLKTLFNFCLKKFYYNIDNQLDVPIKVDCVSGSLFLGTKNIFKVVKGFDDNVFLYYEETILGLKIKMCGKQNYLITNLYYDHFHSRSIDTKFTIFEKFSVLLKSKKYYWEIYKNAGMIFLGLLSFLFAINILELYLVEAVRIVSVWFIGFLKLNRRGEEK